MSSQIPTPSPPLSGWTDFMNTYGDESTDNSFWGKVNDFDSTSAQYASDIADYQAHWNEFDALRKEGNTEGALAYFLMVLAGNVDPNQHDNINGLFDDRVQASGQSLAVNAFTGKLNNLLTNLTDDTVSTDAGGVAITDQVNTANQAIDLLTQVFNMPAVQNSLDPNEVSIIEQQLSSLKSTLSQYFDPSGKDPNKMASFDEMKTLLGKQGDVKGSADAAKSITDALQIITSTVQNTNAAFNEETGQITGSQKSFISVLGAILKDLIDDVNNAIQRMITQ